MKNGWYEINDPKMPVPKDTALLVFLEGGQGYEIGHFNTMHDKWVAGWDGRAIPVTHWQWLPVTPSGEDYWPART